MIRRCCFAPPSILVVPLSSTVSGQIQNRRNGLRRSNRRGTLAKCTQLSTSYRQVSGMRHRRHSSPFRPKQSLGQNFLKDDNIIRKIVTSFCEARLELCPDSSVVEIGAGAGALTGMLMAEFEDMLAVEIDTRAVDVLQENFPALNVLNGDVLDVDWGDLRAQRDAPLAVIGNLPYNIVSQILFSMLEAPRGSLGCALVMMQKEVAERVCAKTRTKAYGILSVVGQLYGKPRMLFDVPNTAFYPRPSITSTMVLLEFSPADCIDIRNSKLTSALRNVVRTAFQQRRKTLRNSLRTLQNVSVPEEWAMKRPEELSPAQFVELTELMYGEQIEMSYGDEVKEITPVWRPRPKKNAEDLS